MIRFTYTCPMRVQDMPRVAGGWQCVAGCGKVVVDLSAMTEDAAVALVRREQVCGRLLFNEVGKPIFAAAAGVALVAGLHRREVEAGVVTPFASLSAAVPEVHDTLARPIEPTSWNVPPTDTIAEVPVVEQLQFLGYPVGMPEAAPDEPRPVVGRVALHDK